MLLSLGPWPWGLQELLVEHQLLSLVAIGTELVLVLFALVGSARFRCCACLCRGRLQLTFVQEGDGSVVLGATLVLPLLLAPLLVLLPLLLILLLLLVLLLLILLLLLVLLLVWLCCAKVACETHWP